MDLILKNCDGEYDLVIENGDLQTDPGLLTAIEMSLMTDARALETDVLPFNYSDRRGYVGDAIDGFNIGSRLWLVPSFDEKNQLKMAKKYVEEALNWLIDDGVVKEIEVVAVKVCKVINFQIKFCKKDDSRYNYHWNFDYSRSC